MKEIMIVSNPRTGSNHFADLFSRFPEVLALSEIFHKDAVWGLEQNPDLLQYVSSRIGLEASAFDDPNIVHLARTAPAKFLDGIRDFCLQNNKMTFAYKAFSHHLPLQAWKDLISETRPIVIFLVRGRLASFISFKKASMTGRWGNVDTTGIKPVLDVDEYVVWAAAQDTWYHEIEEHCHALGLIYSIVEYERDICVEHNELSNFQYYLMRSLGLSPSCPNSGAGSRFNLQDKTDNLVDRAKNGVEFISLILEGQRSESDIFGSPLLSNRVRI